MSALLLAVLERIDALLRDTRGAIRMPRIEWLRWRNAIILIALSLGGASAALVSELRANQEELRRLEYQAQLDGAVAPPDPYGPPGDPGPGLFWQTRFEEGSEWCEARDSGIRVGCFRGTNGVVLARSEAGTITSQKVGSSDSYTVLVPPYYRDSGLPDPAPTTVWESPCSAITVRQSGGGYGGGCRADSPCRIWSSGGQFIDEPGVCVRLPDAGTARPVTPRVYRPCGNPPVPCVCGSTGCTPTGGH